MRAFDIGQMVWVCRDDVDLRRVHVGFFASSIKEIITSEDKNGSKVRYILGNGDTKTEGDLFPSKEDAIDHVISLLEEEKGNE